MRFAPVMTSPIKLNVVYSLTPLGSESKPEERGTSDEGASGEARADLLGEGTPKLAFSSVRARQQVASASLLCKRREWQPKADG